MSTCLLNNTSWAAPFLQTCFHTLSQVVCTHQSKGEPAKMPGPPYATQCCKSQYFMQYFELQSNRKMAHHLFPPCPLRQTPAAPHSMGGPFTPPSRLPLALPDGRPPIRDPALLVGMIRWPPWSVAIATYP